MLDLSGQLHGVDVDIAVYGVEGGGGLRRRGGEEDWLLGNVQMFRLVSCFVVVVVLATVAIYSGHHSGSLRCDGS